MALGAAMVLSGIRQEDFFSDGLDDLFNHGAVLLKSPSASSIASTETAESGFSSMSDSSAVAKNLNHYFELLCSSNMKVKGVMEADHQDSKYTDEHFYEATPTRPIMHQGRNLLDLEKNVKWELWPCQPAVLLKGVQNYFENRSQFARLKGVSIPHHIEVKCKAPDCQFHEMEYLE